MKLKYFILIPMLAAAVMGCKKQLDLVPQQSVKDEMVFSTPSNAFAAVMGLYSTAQALDFYGNMPQIIEEYMGNNVEFVGTFPTLQDINTFSAVSTNSNVSALWQAHYQVIARANKIIAKIGSVPVLDAQLQSEYIGEAKFMRALAYFQLSNLFAQPYQVSSGTNLSVPLVLEDFDPNNILYPSRATLQVIHTQIINDLKDATIALPVDYSSAEETRGRATKGAAYGLLSRIYLYREQWGLSEQAVRDALAQGIYTLAPNYNFYSANSSEDVFTIQNSAIDNGRTGSGGWAAFYVPAASGGRGDAPFSQDLLNAYNAEPTDKRFALKVTGTATDGLSHEFTSKFPDAVNNSDNAPVIRTTELYLNLAEALAKQSTAVADAKAVEAINILNIRLRDRAGLGAKVVTTPAALVEAILLERRKELAFEGHARIDLLRNRKALRVGEPKAAFGAPRTILPIPQREIDNNPGLQGQQNADY